MVALFELWDIVSLMEKPMEPVPCWIAPAVLPKGGKMLLGGHAKIGKSLIMLELARALATGTRPFGCPHLSVPEPVRVLVIEQEIGEWGIQQRARAAFAREPADLLRQNFIGISKARSLRLESRDAVNAIADLCARHEVRVLCLDPIGKLHSYDENDATQVNRLMHRLDEIIDSCRSLGLAIVFTHHFLKPLRDPRIPLTPDQLYSPYNFRGSTRWYDDPDTLVTCNRYNVAGKRWWRIGTRWECRQGQMPAEYMTFAANRHGNLRVEYERDGLPEGV